MLLAGEWFTRRTLFVMLHCMTDFFILVILTKYDKIPQPKMSHTKHFLF